MWTCPKCDAKVDASFEVCWQCGTTRDGVEDPTFVRADDAPPMRNSPDVIGLEPQFGPVDALAEGDLAGDSPVATPIDLVECYWAANVQEAQFLAEQLIEQGIPAVADDDMTRQGLLPAALNAPYFNPRVRDRAEDHSRARAWLEDYEQRRKAEHGHGG
jgi:hypothetical protein